MMRIFYFLLVFVFGMCLFVGCDTGISGKINENTVEETSIKTDYFSMSVPKTWKDIYKYYYRDTNESGDIDLYVSMVSKNEFSEAHLFTVYILSLDNSENIEISLEGLIEPIAIVSKYGTDMYLLGYRLASEMACTAEEEETFLEMIDDVPQIIESIIAQNEYDLRKWDESMREEIIPGDYNSPYAPLSFDILNASFEGYKNQTGAIFIPRTSVKTYYINMLETMEYYYGTNDVIVGVKDNEIQLLTCWPSDIVGYTSPQVREVINKLGAKELFEIYPAVAEVNNSHNTSNFFYWKVENGYVGFVAIGGNEPSNCYSNRALSVLFFKDLSSISFADQ